MLIDDERMDNHKSSIFKKNIISGIPSECQTLWIQIRPDILSGLKWVQTVCKDFQQMTRVGKEFSKFAYLFFMSFTSPETFSLDSSFHINSGFS